MNENVSIKEGNITRKFAPIDKVKVDNTDGTQSIWVPEDDLKTGVLYASENGIYIASEDGYDAYSEVVIRVEKRIDDGDLIDESGTDWKDIDFDGDIGDFDELDNWDVDTLEEFSDDLEGFDDLFNDEDKWDEEKEKPITEDEMGDFDGDSLSGIDPETGNEMEVSLDEDGFLDEEVLPSSIAITRSPFRLTYIDGETIFFTGIQVTAYTEDGNAWDHAGYPNGIIPNKELVQTVHKAVYDPSKAGFEKTSQYINGSANGGNSGSFEFKSIVVYGEYNYYWYTFGIAGGAATLVQRGDGNYRRLAASKTPNASIILSAKWETRDAKTDKVISQDGDVSSYNTDYEITRNGKTAYYGTVDMVGSSNYKVTGPLTQNDVGSSGDIAWTLLYGDTIKEGCIMDVPVYWIRPDGDVLRASYTITVLPNGEGGGGSDDEWDGNISYDGNDYMLNPNSVVGLSYNPESKKVIAPNIGEYNVNQAIDVGLLIPKE